MSFSTKELNYIKDGIAWEELMIKNTPNTCSTVRTQRLKTSSTGWCSCTKTTTITS